jgi:acetyltransferase-like isoleucine patch superfamily enzyme
LRNILDQNGLLQEVLALGVSCGQNGCIDGFPSREMIKAHDQFLERHMRATLRVLTRGVRHARGKLKILLLRLKGCRVDWSACIDPSARVEPSGGSISIGSRTIIDCGVVIRGLGGHVEIGADCALNAYSVLCGGGNIRIGNSVMIASHVSIYAANHVFSSISVPMSSQGLDAKGINIANDVWIGTGVRLLDGVDVGAGSIIAAGAVVTKSVVPFSINAGVPARVIGARVG